ncbi:hypothetical protein [Burkholderia multivorans]|uniref:hypothetical protein n=1 Tax=Burkholderia multivorans TaxID=87883 RepID=UPI0015920BE0|nr:hypothetical protein [Burkholderia multivorans]
MTLDIEKLRAGNPVLDGEGMIPIVEAARTVGMQAESLANELLNDGAHVFTHLHGQSCWRVPVLNDLDRDFGGEFIWNEVKVNGERSVHTGTVRVLDGRATLQQVITTGAAQEGVFGDGNSAGIFLEDPIAIDLARCIVHKTAVTRVRVRLVASLSPASTVALPSPSIISSASIAVLSVPSPSATVGAVPTGLPTRIEPAPVVFDPITAKHGKKRFWDLFELYARSRTWGEDQTRRMSVSCARLARRPAKSVHDDVAYVQKPKRRNPRVFSSAQVVSSRLSDGANARVLTVSPCRVGLNSILHDNALALVEF